MRLNNRFFVFALSILLFYSCSNSNNNTIEKKFDLDWILGSWERTNDKSPKQTFERWEKYSDNEYRGTGYTLVNSDTVFKENLKIVNNQKNWVYEVRGVNENMTPFTFTKITDSSFICENIQNEFPKVISYNIEQDT